jgi:hypothetical protein
MGISLNGLKKVGGNIVNTVKKAATDTAHQAVRSGHDVGAVLDNPLTKATLATTLAASGIGIPLATGIMATEGATAAGLKKGGNLKAVGEGAMRGGVTGAVAGLAGGGEGEAFGGLRHAGSMVKDAIISHLPGSGSSGAAQQGATDAAGAGAGGGGGGITDAISHAILPKNADGSIDWGKAAKLGLTVGTAIEGYQQQHRANDLNNQAVGIAQDEYNAAKPVRDAAMARLAAGPKRPDLANLFDPSNPYRRPLPVVGGY